ncbi:hypothetical protein FISHEDRAFT_71774 [Fistulina hepatica ATCC 64428]|uniref:CRAL-TRIO domain-containing protein n=1 Tax=Fistulina hepatica ATCC 64428 TaxID=1128425 RepID=A0A0D7AH35_9AGAR|nr:hypothetical protein FISHEDRAFT_71774 [Fistulina hepatica ATCC 64428]
MVLVTEIQVAPVSFESASHRELLDRYREHEQDIKSLQCVLMQELESLRDELELSPESHAWIEEYFNDEVTVFHVLRMQRNNFIRSHAIECMHRNVVWRLDHLWPLRDRPVCNTKLLSVLSSTHDTALGMPMLHVTIGSIHDDIHSLISYSAECLRLYIQRLNEIESTNKLSSPTVLQYLILLDIKALSLKVDNLDILRWTVEEIYPKFPGMLAAVYVVNYTWTQGGIWHVIKQMLPDRALRRIFFLRERDLLDRFPPASIPRAYGGSLPDGASLPLFELFWPSSAPNSASSDRHARSANSDPVPACEPPLSRISLSSTSLDNPFFGYPTTWQRGTAFLRHGRRRKRDLVRTLLVLLWRRWHLRIYSVLWIIAILVILANVHVHRLAPRRVALSLWFWFRNAPLKFMR